MNVNPITRVILVAGIGLLFASHATLAYQREPEFDTRYLEGIKQIILVSDVSRDTMKISRIDGYQLDRWLYTGFKPMFASVPGVSIKSEYGTPPIPRGDWADKDAILVFFYLRAREEIVEGKPVKIAALSVSMRQSLSNPEPAYFTPRPEPYPFLLPATKEELERKIQEGVRVLTGDLAFELCFRHEQGVLPCKSPLPEIPHREQH